MRCEMKLFLEKLFFLDELSPWQICLRRIWLHLKYTLKNLIKYKTTDVFHIVGIQTITACNRKCSYCPNSLYPREKKLIDPELFKKIINDLAAIDYSGAVSPFFYGEPLLDERLPELLSYARQKLPKARIYVHTNGDFLAKEVFEKLIKSGVNQFVITQHENKPPQKFMEWYKNASLKERNRIVFKKLDENSPLTNRGGLIKIKKKGKFISRICPLPKTALFIDVNGNLLLCCNDFFGNYSFGNVKEKPLIEIWNGEKYKKCREEISKSNFSLEICKKCVS